MENIEMASALRAFVSKMHKRLRHQAHTIDGLSLTEVTTLSYLYYNGSLFPSQIAQMVKVKAQSVSQIISKLEELKLIVKTPSETDKRKTAISLSAHGKHFVELTRDERDKWLTQAIENTLTPGEQKLLQQAVTLLDKLTEYQP